jgi:hypothetical protein
MVNALSEAKLVHKGLQPPVKEVLGLRMSE